MKCKTPKPIDCSNCKFMCGTNFTEELRAEICKSFWQLDDYRRQKDFILMNVKSSSPKRRRPTKEPAENSKMRTNSKSFFLLNKRVCQSFFLKTLAISNGPLIKAFQHKNVYTNFFDGDDKRGKHTPSNKLGGEVVASVINHFEQFTGSSSRSKKQTITDPKVKSLRHLYSLYLEANEHMLSYTSFKRIFNENNFIMPPERLKVRMKAVPKIVIVEEAEEENEQQLELSQCFDDDVYEEIQQIEQEEMDLQSIPQQNIIIAQVPDNAKYFDNSQIYEIQFIDLQLPLMSTVVEQS